MLERSLDKPHPAPVETSIIWSRLKLHASTYHHVCLVAGGLVCEDHDHLGAEGPAVPAGEGVVDDGAQDRAEVRVPAAVLNLMQSCHRQRRLGRRHQSTLQAPFTQAYYTHGIPPRHPFSHTHLDFYTRDALLPFYIRP